MRQQMLMVQADDTVTCGEDAVPLVTMMVSDMPSNIVREVGFVVNFLRAGCEMVQVQPDGSRIDEWRAQTVPMLKQMLSDLQIENERFRVCFHNDTDNLIVTLYCE